MWPADCGVFQTLGVGVAQIGGIYVPDLCVVPTGAVPRDANPASAEEVLLAVEITSPAHAAHDRKKKRWAYAHGRIQQYLSIDRYDEEGPAATLFTDPEDGVYRKALRTPFGRPVALEPPFELELDTSVF